MIPDPDTNSDVLLITFDMPEDNLFSQFDICGLRGWEQSPSELISASASEANAQPSKPSPFKMDMEIPMSARTTKTASSTLAVLRISENQIAELSNAELPILMPDNLVYDEANRSIFVSNNSIGIILVYTLVLPSFKLEEESQSIRLDAKHFPMGMALVQNKLLVLTASHSQTVDSVEAGKKSMAGFSASPFIEVDLSLVSYSRTALMLENSNTKSMAEYQQSVLEQVESVEQRVFGGMVSSGMSRRAMTMESMNDESDDDHQPLPFLADGRLRMPGDDTRSRPSIVLVHDMTPSLGKVTIETEPANAGNADTEMKLFMNTVERRLDRIEDQQLEILSLLRALTAGKGV
ncbi:hypothetical protein BDR26DRAFT_853528 [Obelidium mucronatum]|nr:hypothetical protein BDR26DRAFT_853528 [Obelidium mucronatum]